MCGSSVAAAVLLGCLLWWLCRSARKLRRENQRYSSLLKRAQFGGGHAVPPEAELVVSAAMGAAELRVFLGLPGAGRGVAWGCDLSAEYVSINADYRS